MALGKKFWVFDESDLIKGVSTSDDLGDAGFSPLTDAINPIASPGVLYQPAQPTDKSTNVVGEVIASCEDPLVSGADRVFLDDEGHFYTWNGTTMTLKRTDGAHNYVQGKTDMTAYQTAVFATSDTTVVKWTVDSGFDAAYYTFTGATGATDGSVPHPCLTYEDNIYYGNHQLLLRQTGVSTAPAVVLTLPEDRIIVALAIDPGSGKMLISTTGNLNLSDTKNCLAKVYYYDGQSNKTQKVVQVEQMITAFPTSEGGLFAAYGNNLGYWNGSGVTFLRNFSEITYNNNYLFYKHHFTNIGSTLYFVVMTRIYAYGPVRQGGNHVFYPAFKNSVDLTHVANIGSGTLAFAYATDKFYTWNTTDVSTSNTQTFYTNENPLSNFNDGVWLRRIKIFWKSQVSNNVDPGSLRILNEDGVVTSIGQTGLFDLLNSSGAASAVKEIVVGGGTGLRLNQIQLNMILVNVNPGIRRIVFYGEPANQD